MFGGDAVVGVIAAPLVTWLETAHFAGIGEVIEGRAHLICVLDDCHGRVANSCVGHKL